jgi:hypothetical protein
MRNTGDNLTGGICQDLLKCTPPTVGADIIRPPILQCKMENRKRRYFHAENLYSRFFRGAYGCEPGSHFSNVPPFQTKYEGTNESS